eukprot:1159380-Pelagomonas_calceolata.AAC.1
MQKVRRHSIPSFASFGTCLHQSGILSKLTLTPGWTLPDQDHWKAECAQLQSIGLVRDPFVQFLPYTRDQAAKTTADTGAEALPSLILLQQAAAEKVADERARLTKFIVLVVPQKISAAQDRILRVG